MTDRRRRLRRTVAVAAALAMLTGLGVGLRFGYRYLAGPACEATAGGVSLRFTTEQTHHAATITAAAVKRGLPARAATIALATALQESGLRNVTYGDRDSLGLFQQRPSQGWGTAAQVQDPVYAANAFYDALVKVSDYEDRDITEVAQAVQRSAYPSAYRDHEQEGRVLASTLYGHSPGGLGCRLDRAERAGDSRALAADLLTQLGESGHADGPRVTVNTTSPTDAWAVASWAVAQADARAVVDVVIGDRRWARDSGDGFAWESVAATGPDTAVTITLSRG